ncbi:MAG TPA: zf-HC2 domain-containing protein [Chthonomonadaceae bacterium]|nr:zf-HC2 domain-containing protein [Chthonomonadaceae bacterium]
MEHTPPEENQGWGAYATPPPVPGQQHTPYSGLTPEMSLCARVRERLPALLENDGEIRPELAAQIYAHLAACPGCAQEFDQQQRLVAMLEALPPVEMPMDFSRLIMQRIQGNQAVSDTAQESLTARPFASPSSASSEGAQTHAGSEVGQQAEAVIQQRTPVKGTKTLPKGLLLEQKVTRTKELVSLTSTRLLERLTLASLLSALIAFFLMSGWGRQMFGANVDGVASWLAQIGDVLRRIPLLGALFAAILLGLSQVAEMIRETYRSLGATAANGLALDVALCAAAYYFLALRRQRGQRLGV